MNASVNSPNSKKKTLTTSLLSGKQELYSGVFTGGDEEILNPKTFAKFLLATFGTEFLKQGLDFEQMLFLKPRLTTTGNCFFMVATPNGQSNEYEQLPKQKNAIFNRNTSLLEKKFLKPLHESTLAKKNTAVFPKWALLARMACTFEAWSFCAPSIADWQKTWGKHNDGWFHTVLTPNSETLQTIYRGSSDAGQIPNNIIEIEYPAQAEKLGSNEQPKLKCMQASAVTTLSTAKYVKLM